MKIFIKTFLAITIISAFLFSACKKYEDGPLLSLRSKKARLCGKWTIGLATYNGHDQTADYQALITEFDINTSGSYSIKGAISDDGNWKFGEDKDDVAFTSNSGAADSHGYHILRLKHKDVWFRETLSNGDIREIHLKQ